VSSSALYEGAVRHRRFAVREREFSYDLALAYVDLDELPELLGGRLVRRAPGLVRWRRRDYLGDPRVLLADAVRDLVEERTGARPEGPVRQLTQLRTLGHCFNPVSFYYCFDARGLTATVAEVTNTPWGERHAYVIARGDGEAGPAIRGSAAKQLHVSPFMGMDQRYDWNVGLPGDTLSVHIENHRAGAKVFDATLSLRRRELTPAALASATARYPLATGRVLALIYAQALRLKLSGVPVHPHPRASGT
jgi:DUF1365 family protein